MSLFVMVNISFNSTVLFDVGFYCDIFTNIHATMLVFIVIILIIVTVECCGNFIFNSI